MFERGNAMRPVYRSNLFALMLILGQVFGIIFLGGVLKGLLNTEQLLIATQLIFLIVPTIIYFIVTKLPVKETLRLNRISVIDIGIIVLIAFLCQPIASFLSALTNVFFKNLINEVFNEISTIPYGKQLVIMALTPAICEEVTMRGIVLSGYRRISVTKTVIMTGLFFGILHLNAQQFLYAFAMGILFAYLVIITNSIYASVICHFVFNGIQVTVANVIVKLSPEATKNAANLKDLTVMEQLNTLVPLMVSALLFTVFVVMLVKKLYKRNMGEMHLRQPQYNAISEDTPEYGHGSETNHEIGYLLRGNEKPEEESVVNAPFILTVVLYLAIMVATELFSKKPL